MGDSNKNKSLQNGKYNYIYLDRTCQELSEYMLHCYVYYTFAVVIAKKCLSGYFFGNCKNLKIIIG